MQFNRTAVTFFDLSVFSFRFLCLLPHLFFLPLFVSLVSHPLIPVFATEMTVIPECTVRLEAASMDGKSRLTCDVISSPPALNYTWIRGNKSLSDDSRKLLSLRNQSSLMINEDDPLEVFSCVVSNSIGSSKPCRLQTQELNGESGFQD